MNYKKSLILIFGVLFLDQLSKIYIKLSFPLTFYSSDAIVDWGWFRLLFVENKGMAWGTALHDFLPFLSEETAKLLLSLFRVIAVSIIGYWLFDAIRKKQHSLMLLAGSLILAGA